MVARTVQAKGFSVADPAAIWAVAGDFCSAWHPAIDRMQAERSDQGALIRAFTIKGDDTLYKEQLTYRSDSDRTLVYTHLQGISGAESYVARLSVSPAADGGSVVEWTARLAASEDRAGAIADGTKAIFDMGIAALADYAEQAGIPAVRPEAAPQSVSLETMFIGENPRLALTATPAKDGPLVLFLHGIGGNRVNWLPQLPAAASFGRAAALDLRGYGDSRLGVSQSTIDDYCADILLVMESLGAGRIVLCGLSYGSWIATSFAMRHPGKLAGLVLSGGCTGMSEADVEEREGFRRSREVPLSEGKTPADFAPAVVNILAGPDAGADVRQALFDSMAAIPVATYRDALTCFTNPPGRFDFSKLRMPVLMITGEHDRLAAPAEIRGVANRIAEAAPNANVHFEIIAGAGHVCNVERPAAYNAVLTEFLRQAAR